MALAYLTLYQKWEVFDILGLTVDRQLIVSALMELTFWLGETENKCMMCPKVTCVPEKSETEKAVQSAGKKGELRGLVGGEWGTSLGRWH